MARTTTTDFGRIRAEVVQLRKAVDALVAQTSKADETLRQLNAAHEELRGILESINDRSPRNPPDASSSNPWAIPSDHDAFSNSHFSESSSTLPKENARSQRNPVALDDDDDSQYLSTALGLTDWSDVPPRNGYYPTVRTSPRIPSDAYKPTQSDVTHRSLTFCSPGRGVSADRARKRGGSQATSSAHGSSPDGVPRPE